MKGRGQTSRPRRRSPAWVFAAVLAAGFAVRAAPPPAPGTASAEQLYEEVLSLYQQGRIYDAELQVLKILDTRADLSRPDRARFFVLLAFCSVANDDEEAGVRRFRQALEYNPYLAPDPLTWSPKVRRVFERAALEHAAARQKELSLREIQAGSLARQAAMRSLVLPGGGQIMKKQMWRGAVWGAVFWSAALAHGYLRLTLPEQRRTYRDAATPAEAAVAWDDLRSHIRYANFTLAVAAGAYIGALMDALIVPPKPEVLPPLRP